MKISNNTANINTINTESKDKFNNVDMSFLNKPEYTQEEYEVGYNNARDRVIRRTKDLARKKEIFEMSKKEFEKKYLSDIKINIRIYQGQKLIQKYGIPLKVNNPESPIIHLVTDELEIVFKMIESLYYELYLDLCDVEEREEIVNIGNLAVNTYLTIASIIMNMMPGIGQAIATIIAVVSAIKDVIIKKSKTYPKSIKNIRKIVELLVNYAKINDENKDILLNGVDTYIKMQENEYNDYMHPDDYVVLNSYLIETILFIILPKYQQMFKRLSKRGGNPEFLDINDIFPQAGGKDNTNEIDYPKEPIKDEKMEKERRTSESESDGATLDSMRNRQSSEMAGSNKYDYEYSNTGNETKLAKANYIDNTKIYAHNTIVAQSIKSFVLQICSLHYCRIYEAMPIELYQLITPATAAWALIQHEQYLEKIAKYKPTAWEWFKCIFLVDDFCRIDSHIPLDMKESEINPHIKRFNGNSSYETLRKKQERYKDGYYPIMLRDILLEYIDESVERYYKEYLNLYTQIKDKEWHDYIEFKDNKLILSQHIKSKSDIEIYAHEYDSKLYVDYNEYYAKKISVSSKDNSGKTHTNYYPKIIEFIDFKKHYDFIVSKIDTSAGKESALKNAADIYVEKQMPVDTKENKENIKEISQRILEHKEELYSTFQSFNPKTEYNSHLLSKSVKKMTGEWEIFAVNNREVKNADGSYDEETTYYRYVNSIILYYKTTIKKEVDKDYLIAESARVRETLIKESNFKPNDKDIEGNNIEKLEKNDMI